MFDRNGATVFKRGFVVKCLGLNQKNEQIDFEKISHRTGNTNN